MRSRRGRRKIWKNVYAMYTGLCIILGSLFFYIFLISAPQGIVRGDKNDPSAPGQNVKLYGRNERYDVIEDFRAHNPRLGEYVFPPIEVAKSKLIKGYQLFVKSPQARVLGQYGSRDLQKQVTFIERTFAEGARRWTQVDALIANAAAGTYQTVPVSYTYGNWQEQNDAANMVLGFTGQDEFLFLGTRSDGDDLVYTVGSYDLATKQVKPIMDLLRNSPSQTSTSYIVSGWITSDGKRLMLKDNHDIIAEYNLSTGAKTMEFTPPAEGRPNGNYIASAAKDVIFYVSEPFQPTVWLIDALKGTRTQPFAHEKGFVDPGFDASGRMIYYNFTYDRSNRHIYKDDQANLLAAKGVQLLAMDGRPLQRFALAPDTDNCLEFAGYAEEQDVVILHEYTVDTDEDGKWTKKTVDWLTGNVKTGEMMSLEQLDVPDRWEKQDVFFTTVRMDAGTDEPFVHFFGNLADGTYYLPRWKNREIMTDRENNMILYTDDKNKRVYNRSFTRPDLGVALLNFKKYNFNTTDFHWLAGGYLEYALTQPAGVRLYFFQVNP